MAGLFSTSKKEEEEEKKTGGGLFKPSSSVSQSSSGSSGGSLFGSSSTTPKSSSSTGGLFKPSTSSGSMLEGIVKDNPFDTTSLDKSIANAKMRIESAGYPVDQDKRNWFEKATNLPQDQNWFFDTLDIINRPQQALFGGMEAILDTANGTPTNRDKAFMDGLKGLNKTRGSDLMEKLGITNKPTKAALGFTVDVATDPLNLIPASAINKAVGGVGKGAKKGGQAIESAIPSVKTFRETKIQPSITATKDALGHMFVPRYKWDQTLQGGTDDFLKNRFIETENAIRYMGDESLRGVTDAARKAGGLDTGTDAGRIMELNLRMMGPRPVRPLSRDQKVFDAADKLIKSNNALRQWAVSNDIPVGEIEGYMRHILSAEETALRKAKKGKPIDYTPKDMNSPDKSVLRSRELQGSVEDINDMIGRKFFEPNAYFATALGQKKLIEYGNAVKFRKDVLDNPAFAQKADANTIVPEGAVKIDTNNYKFLNNPNNPAASADIGGQYIVTPGVKQALDRYNRLTTDEGINAFLKGYDKVQSGWKKLTLLSLPYHIRNDVGAKFNNYVGGMNPEEITRFSTSATGDVINALARGKESPLYNEFRRQGLGSNSQLAMEFARHGNDAEKALRDIVKDQSRSGARKALGYANPFRVFKTSQELGTAIDQINRMALYKWARQSKGMSPEQAAAKVKEVQFDYSDLTPVERELFVRAIPFYRWSRNNIPYQLNRLVRDPAKYSNVGKAKEAAQDYFGMDPENESQFTKNNLAFPITGDGEGRGKMLGLNLPAADLTKVGTPMRLLTDSVSPLIKTPFELARNFDLFKGREIQQFEGEKKKFQVPQNLYGIPLPGAGTQIGELNPLTAHAMRQLGGQPVRGLMDNMAVQTERDKEEAAVTPSFGIKSMLKNYDIDETNFYEKKAELRRLMDLLDYIEQETGQRPKSVNDIKKGL